MYKLGPKTLQGIKKKKLGNDHEAACFTDLEKIGRLYLNNYRKHLSNGSKNNTQSLNNSNINANQNSLKQNDSQLPGLMKKTNNNNNKASLKKTEFKYRTLSKNLVFWTLFMENIGNQNIFNVSFGPGEKENCDINFSSYHSLSKLRNLILAFKKYKSEFKLIIESLHYVD